MQCFSLLLCYLSQFSVSGVTHLSALTQLTQYVLQLYVHFLLVSIVGHLFAHLTYFVQVALRLVSVLRQLHKFSVQLLALESMHSQMVVQGDRVLTHLLVLTHCFQHREVITKVACTKPASGHSE